MARKMVLVFSCNEKYQIKCCNDTKFSDIVNKEI